MYFSRTLMASMERNEEHFAAVRAFLDTVFVQADCALPFVLAGGLHFDMDLEGTTISMAQLALMKKSGNDQERQLARGLMRGSPAQARRDLFVSHL